MNKSPESTFDEPVTIKIVLTPMELVLAVVASALTTAALMIFGWPTLLYCG